MASLRQRSPSRWRRKGLQPAAAVSLTRPSNSSSSLCSLVFHQAQVVRVLPVLALQHANRRRHAVHDPDQCFFVAGLHALHAHRAIAQLADLHIIELGGNVVAVVARPPSTKRYCIDRPGCASRTTARLINKPLWSPSCRVTGALRDSFTSPVQRAWCERQS